MGILESLPHVLALSRVTENTIEAGSRRTICAMSIPAFLMNTPDPPMRFNCIGAMFWDVIPTSRIAGNDGYQGSIANRAFISGTIGLDVLVVFILRIHVAVEVVRSGPRAHESGQHDPAAQVENGKIRRHGATGPHFRDLAVANHQHAVGYLGRG